MDVADEKLLAVLDKAGVQNARLIDFIPVLRRLVKHVPKREGA
jgi:hypothetical protein